MGGKGRAGSSEWKASADRSAQCVADCDNTLITTTPSDDNGGNLSPRSYRFAIRLEISPVGDIYRLRIAVITERS